MNAVIVPIKRLVVKYVKGDGKSKHTKQSGDGCGSSGQEWFLSEQEKYAGRGRPLTVAISNLNANTMRP